MAKKGQSRLYFWIKVGFIVASFPLIISDRSWAEDCTPKKIQAKIEQFKDKTKRAEALKDVRDAVGECGEGAVIFLEEALTNPDHSAMRANAVLTLGEMGAIAQEAAPELVRALEDSDETVRSNAALSLSLIGQAVQAQPDSLFELDLGSIKDLESLKQSWEDALKHLKEDKREWASKEKEIENLRLVSSGWETKLNRLTNEGLYQVARWFKENPVVWLSPLGAVGVVVFYLGVFFVEPIFLLKLNGLVKSAELEIPIVKFKVPLSRLLVFKYHPRVLDAWVKKNLDKAEQNFKRKETVKERELYISVPVTLKDNRKSELSGQDLQLIFQEKRFCLLISGEGGAGKTSLACQIAKWGMDKEKAKRPTKHLMLPVLIEQELSNNDGEEKPDLVKAINGQLQELIGRAESISDDLVEALVRNQRVLVIVDHLSEMSEKTRQEIRPHAPEFPVKALIVTSRIKENLGDVVNEFIETCRIDSKQLSGFIYDYLKARNKRNLFEDRELFDACTKLTEMVEERKAITVFLAKLYAEQLINSKGKSVGKSKKPDNIPDLILGYLKEINQKAESRTGKEYPNLARDAKHLAWKCLEESYKPKEINSQIVKQTLDRDDVQEYLDYWEKELRLIRKVGVAEEKIRFTLAPLTEYLAGLHLIDQYEGKEEDWQGFLKQVDSRSGTIEEIKGFLLAVRDCCLAKGSVPGFVSEELGRRGGLDPEAIQAAQRKRRVRRLIEELDAPEKEYRLRAVTDLGAMGKDATVAIPSLRRVLEKDSEVEIRLEALRSLKQLGVDDSRIPILEIKADVESIRLIEPLHTVKIDLGNGVTLEMVSIPGGKFLMGTQDEEIERLVQKFNVELFRSEKPQHEVTVQPFFMAKFQVTQAQWRAITSLPKVKHDLDPNPAHFKDHPNNDRRPVEQVSWDDAVEFCQRLSKQTAKEYRLPSEAEWEYACRAGTLTPFHFGETITGELANYRASETYASEPKGKYREQTTPVGSFPSNLFGVYDMHGNVWEWCADTWHGNYEGAPTDGSAWLFGNRNTKVIRGGSWDFNPSLCRSACRDDFTRVNRDSNVGFRVACVAL